MLVSKIEAASIVPQGFEALCFQVKVVANLQKLAATGFQPISTLNSYTLLCLECYTGCR